MDIHDFSLEHFNSTLQESASSQDINFCQAIALSPKKVSISLHYCPQKELEEYAVLNSDLSSRLSSDFSCYYYGCSPEIDNNLIIGAINHLSLCDTAGLEDFISNHCCKFMLHRNQKAYLLDIAKLLILTVASKFGVSLKMHVENILYLRLSKDS